MGYLNNNRGVRCPGVHCFQGCSPLSERGERILKILHGILQDNTEQLVEMQIEILSGVVEMQIEILSGVRMKPSCFSYLTSLAKGQGTDPAAKELYEDWELCYSSREGESLLSCFQGTEIADDFRRQPGF